MHIPSNHERIQTISEVVQEQLERHREQGGKRDDDKATRIAARAIQELMPQLVEMQRSRVTVEASRGFSVLNRTSKKIDGLHVQAKLQRVAVNELISTMGTDDDYVALSTFDLHAVLLPRYEDAEPWDLIYGEELYVPFSDIQLFESSDA